MDMESEERNAATLNGQRGIVVGHGAMPHPANPDDGFVALFVVLIPTQWVVCLSQAEFGGYDYAESRKGLGAPVDGETFAKFAARGIPVSVPFGDVKDTIEKSWPDAKMEWLQESDNEKKVVVP